MLSEFDIYNTIRINGIIYNKSQLNNFNRSNDFENKIVEFLNEWFNLNDTIEVNTSGSTGVPKKTILAKTAMVVSAKQTISFFNINSSHNLLLCLPVDFIAGKMMIVRAIVSGANLVISKPIVNPLLQTPNEIYFAAFTPFQIAQIVKDDFTITKFNEIKKVIIGGGEINSVLEKKLWNFTNDIYATYGMTETITHIALRKIAKENSEPVFKTLKGILLGLDKRNCLTISAPYLGTNVIVTNDIVDFLGPGEFVWLGRYDNVINSGGIKLFPEKIESKIKNFFNYTFFIKGVYDEELGQKVCMVIEGQPFDKTTMALLTSSLKDNLEKYEIPKEFVFIPEFTYTGTGKLIRQ